MIFPWTSPPAASPPPRINDGIQAFFAAIAPPAAVLPQPAEKPSVTAPAAPIAPLHFTAEGSQHIAELRIRQWLMQRERDERLERDRRLQPPLPPKRP